MPYSMVRFASLLALLCLGLSARMAKAESPIEASGKARRVCFYLNSYAKGYAWSDGIEQALRQQLAGHCDVITFDMDTKRHPDEAFAIAAGARAHAAIEAAHPTVIIASDDAASKYVIMPFYKDAKVPVVFCGVNWSGADYGYPYSNATGMLEVFPLKPLADAIRQVLPGAKRGGFMAADTITDRKASEKVLNVFTELGFKMTAYFAQDEASFQRQFKASQSNDFVLFTTISGIQGLTPETAKRIVEAESRAFSVGWLEFSLPYVMLGMSVEPAEQGEYAGQVAVKVMDGAKIASFPIVPNMRWNVFANDRLLSRTGLKLPEALVKVARPVP